MAGRHCPCSCGVLLLPGSRWPPLVGRGSRPGLTAFQLAAQGPVDSRWPTEQRLWDRVTSRAFTVPLLSAARRGQTMCMWDQEGRLAWFPVWRRLVAMVSGHWGLEEVAEEGAALAPGAAGAWCCCHRARRVQVACARPLAPSRGSRWLWGSLEFTCGQSEPRPTEGWTRRAASLALSLNPSSQGGQPCRPHWSLHPSERPCPPASTRVRLHSVAPGRAPASV